METTQQVIEGGSLVDSIAKLLFGGLNKALSDAVEYEEEMGVLKQVNRIPIKDNNSGREYTLTIKLAPVKNKQNLYYVEAETTAPGLDVSSIHEKTMKLDNSNIKDFNAMLQKLLAKSNMTADLPNDDPTDDSDDEADTTSDNDTDETSDNDADAQDPEITALIEDLKSEYSNIEFIGSEEGVGVVSVIVAINDFDPKLPKEVSFVLTGVGRSDLEGKTIIPEKKYTIPAINSSDEVISANEASGSITDIVLNEYIPENGFNKNRFKRQSYNIASSTNIEATFIKDKESGEISITAINASTNIKAAMDIIYDIAEDSEFADSLEDDVEQSFSISDNGEDYDVEPIDYVETENMYEKLFAEASADFNRLRAFQWAVGERQWQASTLLSSCMYPLSNLEENCAIWVLKHCPGTYPAPVSPFDSGTWSMDMFKDLEGRLSVDMIEEWVVTWLEDLLDELDIYYINLEHEEQKVLDDFINTIKNMLVYA